MIRSGLCAGALAGALAFDVSPAPAPDVNAMTKWTAATVVHYRVVGEFKATWTIR